MNNWKKVRKNNLPKIDEPVLLAYDDYIFEGVYYLDRTVDRYYWDKQDSDGEGNYNWNDPDYWMYLNDIDLPKE